MVLRQHRVSSHPSSESADSQLSPREMPQSGAGLSERAACHAVFELEIPHLPALGRTTLQAGRLQPPQSFSQATEIKAVRWNTARSEPGQAGTVNSHGAGQGSPFLPP